jgi:hypothetical protein
VRAWRRTWRTAGEDVRGGELLAVGGDLDVRTVDPGEREHDGGVGQRQQVVDLEGEVVGDLREAVPAAAGGEDFEQPGQPARADVGQRRVDGGRHGPARLSWRGRRGGRGLERVDGGLLTTGEDAVDGVDQGLEPGPVPVARAGQLDGELGPDAAGVGGQHEDAVGEEHSLLDVVGDDQDRLDRRAVPFPQLDELTAQVLRRQHVERGERLVHQQRVRLGDDGAGETDPLPHAAGQFLRVGGLEAVQADQVDRPERALGPLGIGDAAGLKAELDVLLDGEPRQQREGLEDHRHPGIGPGERAAPVGDAA